MRILMTVALVLGSGVVVGQWLRAQSQEPQLKLNKGDHIAIIGNTLADRMQHDGWLETEIQSRFPALQLVIRNLGFSADEITFRPRSARFGTPDEWLSQVKADVVFAFFGYNESFKGEEGIEEFKKSLTELIKQTTTQNYSGRGKARIVLFSPISHEDLKNPHLPDGKANNARLKLYSEAMAEVAKANQVPYVDLFQATQKLYAEAKTPLTINGIHMNERGNQLLSEVIGKTLFGTTQEKPTEYMEKLRQAVKDKSFHWFERYRTTDGYSIYGERSFLKFTNDQTNREVAQREMEVLDVMTANRDKRIWSVAQGGDSKVDDSNLPPFIPVISNKQGPLPGGKHVFLSGEEAISRMKIGKNLKVNLFASEEKFPELAKPVQMSFDAQGRLWVAVWPSYPHWKPTEDMNDKLLIFEDTDGDGKADKMTIFADKLHNPTGFELWNGGVIVAEAPDLIFLKDTDGDGKADVRQRIVHGLDSADTHHTSNSFTFDPGGGLYFQEGTFHHTSVETPFGPAERCINAGVFRFQPFKQKFEVYVSYGFANPHGHVFDRWGQDIVIDGTGSQPYHGTLFSGKVVFPDKHRGAPQVYQQRTRPCPGIEFLSSKHFPADWQGNMLVGNVIGFQGIQRYKISDNGSSFSGEEQEPILSSTDPNFRPSDLKIGPDGAIYFIDWHNPIIGHMQHNLRDPNRDREHGRIYKVTYEGSPLNKPVKIAGEPTAKLLDLLKEPEDRVRYRVRLELSSRPGAEVIREVQNWVSRLDRTDPNFEHHRLEALWQHQWHDIINGSLLNDVLASPDFRARAAAVKLLSYWKDDVPHSLELVKKMAKDSHPRVRLEAVRTASFYLNAEAMEVPLIVSEQPKDKYIEYLLGETMRTLLPFWKKAVAAGKAPKFQSENGMKLLIGKLSVEEVMKLPKSAAIFTELLMRKGVRDEVRKDALSELSGVNGKSKTRTLLEIIEAGDQKSDQDESVVFDHLRLMTSFPADEIQHVRSDLAKLAGSAKLRVTRQLAYAALITADQGPDKAWKEASSSISSQRDFMTAVPMLKDPNHRAVMYSKAMELLTHPTKDIAENSKIMGRFVRIELPGKARTLTLAEVEVMHDGRNIARQGAAKQKATAHGGVAERAIDGNKSGIYAQNGQTHTPENGDDPWWELDLKREFPLESINIYNRTEGNFHTRMNDYTVKVLDSNRQVVFERTKQPAMKSMATIRLGSESPAEQLRHASMIALTAVRGQEANTIKSLVPLLSKDADRSYVVDALSRIPIATWPQDQAMPVLSPLLTWLGKLPVDQRSSSSATEVLQLAEQISILLPAKEAKTIRKQLREMGVRMLRLGTLTEQMLFDQDRLIVEAGKPVEILFANTDVMPHNIVLLQPGSLNEIGELTDATATDPKSLERQFIPDSRKVILGSRLLQPRESQKLSFTAPTKPGVYPYVCTYPGHWRRMHGAMYVVADLDAWLDDSEAYLKANPMTIADELLKNNRPRREWKLDDLAEEVEKMASGRSIAQGRHLFTAATCISCHKMEEKGQNFGPDLSTQLDPKWKAKDILQHVLDPSEKIDDKFKSWTIELSSGKSVTGMILKETPTSIELIENPQVSTKSITIPISQIEDRKPSKTSLMPKGLLDKFTKDEILDILAYVVSKGNVNHPLYRSADAHGHRK